MSGGNGRDEKHRRSRFLALTSIDSDDDEEANAIETV